LREKGEAEGDQKRDKKDVAQVGRTEGCTDVSKAAQRIQLGVFSLEKRLRKPELDQENIDHRQQRHKQQRNRCAKPRHKRRIGKDPAQGWPDHKTDSEGCANEAKVFGPVFRRGYIGNTRQNNGDVAPRKAREHPRGKKQPQDLGVHGIGKQQIAYQRTCE